MPKCSSARQARVDEEHEVHMHSNGRDVGSGSIVDI